MAVPKKAVSTIPPHVKSTLEGLLEAGRCSDPKAVERLLTHLWMKPVYQTLKTRKITKRPFADRDDLIVWFLSHAVSLCAPLKLRTPLFTIREINRAPKKKKAAMEWHVTAPGSREPALSIYLALLANEARVAFGTSLYRTVATVANVVLDREDVTEKQVRSALRIFNPVSKTPKVKLYRLTGPK